MSSTTAPALTRNDLIAAMGLGYDPFVNAYSEGDFSPRFSEIFVEPRPSLIAGLRRPKPTVIVGDYGAGKTAARLALEFALRNAPAERPRLCVTYTPRIDDLAGEDPDELLARHYAGMASAGSIDLVVQVVERIDDMRRALTSQQREALHRQVRALPWRLQQRIQAVANDPPAMGAFWSSSRRSLGGWRPVVRHVAVTPRWRALLADMASAVDRGTAPQPWRQIVADAQTLGFSQIFVLVDAIDEGSPDPRKQSRLIAPLITQAEDLARDGIVMKCFLPQWPGPEGKSGFWPGNTLTEHIEIATIDAATPEILLAIIHERLQAASSSPASFLSLDVLQHADVGESIEDRLAALAHGSPRRMLELVSALLDFHAGHGFQQMEQRGGPYITREEWEQFLAQADTLLSSG